MTDVLIDGESLTPEDVVAVAREGATVAFTDEARTTIRASRDRIEDILEHDEAVYGVNTGFGDLVSERIPKEDLATLQENLIRSHASGTGDELDREVVRAMMLARANTLAKGYSGIRERVVEALVTMLNEGIHPVVRSRGSLGASGDLAPLAHMALVLIGEGQAEVADDPPAAGGADRLPGDDALATAGLEPLSLEAKEGLALINGTQLTVGIGALAVVDAERTLRAADAAGALTTEVTMSTTANCDPKIHEIRPHAGQAASARNVRRLTANSGIIESHRNCDRIQDAYSIRCLPQVHGAARDAVEHLREAVEVELNSATDNPLVFPADGVDDRASGTGRAAVLSGGNFHGAPLAHRLDYFVAAMADLASICERRTDRLLNPHVQEPHLEPFLADHGGLESGYMIAQYTAAALVNDLRSTGRAGTDSTPVSGNQEDHVSMSANAAIEAREAVESAATVVGIELLSGTRALGFVDDDLGPGMGTGAVATAVEPALPDADGDQPLHGPIDDATVMVLGGLIEERTNAVLEDDLE
jgi:histidine ammonia-lyase